MNWDSHYGLSADQRRQQRDALKRFRELERQAKMEAKLSAIGQAKLEVETYQSCLEILSSIHKQQGPIWDWKRIASSLPPHLPRRLSRNELKAKLNGWLDSDASTSPAATADQARRDDEQDYQAALRAHAKEAAEIESSVAFAKRILSGENKAYTEALLGFTGLAEVSDLGSSIRFTILSPTVVECGLTVNGREVIPKEQKSLTASGKLSVKPLPQIRFHEIYQDYVCGCVLRVAREVFALLPVETVLVTASVNLLDSSSGHGLEQRVLSVAFGRAAFQYLNFERLDPSDTVETFLHRGDAKASKKTGKFESIEPLTIDDLPSSRSIEDVEYQHLFKQVAELRTALATSPRNGATRSTSLVTGTTQIA